MNTETPFDPRPAIIAELAKLGVTAEPLHHGAIKIIGEGDNSNTDHYVTLKRTGNWRSDSSSVVVVGHRASTTRYKLKPGNVFNVTGAAIRLIEMHRKKLESRANMAVIHAEREQADATLNRLLETLGGAGAPMHDLQIDTSNHDTDKVLVKLWKSFTPDQVVRLHALLATFKQEA